MAKPLGGVFTPQSSPLASSIPLEVLLQINKSLTTPEFGNLRLTCKLIENQLLNAFTKEFFQKRQFMFTEFSLQTLLDISRSRFSSTLKYVIFGLDQPSMIAPRALHRPTIVNSPSNLEKENYLMLQYLNHAAFLGTGQDVEMLAQAFSSLPQLETVGLRDFNSRSRYRDAPKIVWNSYGYTTYYEQTGIRTQIPYGHRNLNDLGASDQGSFIHRVFQNILRAVGKSTLSLKNIEVILRSSFLGDRAFNCPKFLEPTIRPVLSNLRTLFLDLDDNPVLMHVEAKGVVKPCPSYFLMKFLSNVVMLEHLRLNIRPSQDESILSWLSRSPPDASNAAAIGGQYKEPLPVTLKYLRRIDLGMAAVDPALILAIIRKHQASLREISLHRISLLHKADVPADERINLWAKLFENMSKLDLKLDAINMSLNSQQQPGGQHWRRVKFKDMSSGKDHTKRWAGNDTQSGLRDFRELVTIPDLDHDTDVESDEGFDVDDVDDSMDDLDHEDDDDNDDDDEDMDDDE
ncbi:hypothetical protein WAI453_005512 [Rhynchosporium graminicola]|uniref:F-box domain-containing protein n=1 Tax=Rhynchosporium graminicola TaxID=2792576 RepID=A0A1E1L410_9HELO|nr:uncharacterized protein RCO7_05389 [Rhynchosporium commune]